MTDLTPIALLVEDEPQVRCIVRMALEAEGWQVHESDSPRRGLIDASTRTPNLIVLNLGFPEGNGVDFIRDLRKWSPVPVIVLSARLDQFDKIAALDAGADDYLTKPFGVGDLLARVHATRRRQRQPAESTEGMVSFGDVKLDLLTWLVTRRHELVRLTPTEFRLLSLLVMHCSRVVTKPQLTREVWGPAQAENGHYLRIYMAHLRHKLEVDPTQPKYLLTEAAVGYRLLLPA